MRMTSTTASAAIRASWRRAFIRLANTKTPPLRLPLGSDTVERIEAKNAFVAKELAAWREVSTSTDWTEEAA
ncbi:hypothetical protein [Bradyrhizobium sp. AUGA SZCCT0431]|uniref:hypothetical protein n=1 Tax=Bradyrhizobium sp. AUGA SZCCT0431 TaxID=2807674 RepID=UPI002012DCBC|nr:hypothetical protein [Bradyrhizobium sp. AUGA SZCCT0431]